MTVTYARNDMVLLGPLIDEIHAVNPFIGKDLVAKSILRVILEGPSRLFNNPDAQGEDMLPLQVDGQGGEVFSQNRISFIDRLWSHKVIETPLRLRLAEAVCSIPRTAAGKDEAIAAQADAGLAALRNAWPELWDPTAGTTNQPPARTGAMCHEVEPGRQNHVTGRIVGGVSRWLRATVFANQHDDDELENDWTPKSERAGLFDVERLLDFFKCVAMPAHWAAALFTATGFAVPQSLVASGAAEAVYVGPLKKRGRKPGCPQSASIQRTCIKLLKAGKIPEGMDKRRIARLVNEETGYSSSLDITTIANLCGDAVAEHRSKSGISH